MSHTILLLEDEPMILLDIEYACEDRGCTALSATTCSAALAHLEGDTLIDMAVLDFSLSDGETCIPVAAELRARGIPFLLHSGDLDRSAERVRQLDAPLIAKPTPPSEVIAAAIELFEKASDDDIAEAAQ